MGLARIDERCRLGCQEELGADGGEVLTYGPTLHQNGWGVPQG